MTTRPNSKSPKDARKRSVGVESRRRSGETEGGGGRPRRSGTNGLKRGFYTCDVTEDERSEGDEGLEGGEPLRKVLRRRSSGDESSQTMATQSNSETQSIGKGSPDVAIEWTSTSPQSILEFLNKRCDPEVRRKLVDDPHSTETKDKIASSTQNNNTIGSTASTNAQVADSDHPSGSGGGGSGGPRTSNPKGNSPPQLSPMDQFQKAASLYRYLHNFGTRIFLRRNLSYLIKYKRSSLNGTTKGRRTWKGFEKVTSAERRGVTIELNNILDKSTGFTLCATAQAYLLRCGQNYPEKIASTKTIGTCKMSQIGDFNLYVNCSSKSISSRLQSCTLPQDAFQPVNGHKEWMLESGENGFKEKASVLNLRVLQELSKKSESDQLDSPHLKLVVRSNVDNESTTDDSSDEEQNTSQRIPQVTEFPFPTKLIYRFVVDQTKSGGDDAFGYRTQPKDIEKCPFCFQRNVDLWFLLKHLRTCHARLQFIYKPWNSDRDTPMIEIRVNPSFNTSNEGSHLRDYKVTPLPKPHHRHSFTHVLVSRMDHVQVQGSRRLEEFQETEEKVKDVGVYRKYGHVRQYFHSQSLRPLVVGDDEGDSDGEIAPDWMQMATCRYLSDYTDVSADEKEVTMKWNTFIMQHKCFSNRLFHKTVEKFVETVGVELVAAGLVQNLVLHLAMLHSRNYITLVQFRILNRQITLLAKQKHANCSLD